MTRFGRCLGPDLPAVSLHRPLKLVKIRNSSLVDLMIGEFKLEPRFIVGCLDGYKQRIGELPFKPPTLSIGFDAKGLGACACVTVISPSQAFDPLGLPSQLLSRVRYSSAGLLPLVIAAQILLLRHVSHAQYVSPLRITSQ